MPEKSFAEQFRTTRKHSCLSQSDINKLLHISLQTIQQWESGENVPPENVQTLVLEKIKQYAENPSPSFAAMFSFVCKVNDLSPGIASYFLKVPTKTVMAWIMEEAVPTEEEQESILETLCQYTAEDATPLLPHIARYIMQDYN